MKKIASFTSQTQAFLATQALLNQNIKSEIVGAKEYSAIITGTDAGKYELLVDWADEVEAMKVINEIQNHLLTPQEKSPILPGTYFKKAIVFSLLASVFLPVVFNYVAFQNLREYLKVEKESAKRTLGSVIIILLQIPTIVVVYMFLHSLM